MSLAAGMLVGVAALAGYAGYVEPRRRLVVRRWRTRPEGWPRGRRLRIAALSDLHAGAPYLDEVRIARIVERTNVLQPDLTVLLGDYTLDHWFVRRRIPVERVADLLGGLRAPLGVYAILGNHDFWRTPAQYDADPLRAPAHAPLERAGIAVLDNDAVRIDDGASGFWLLGLGDQLAYKRIGGRPPGATRGDAARRPGLGVDDLAATLARIADDAPAILLAHEPYVFRTVPSRVALTLSGHTHGGQIRIGGWSPVVRKGRDLAYGLVERDGRSLVVSGGLGCSTLPIRLGLPPEITLVELGGEPG